MTTTGSSTATTTKSETSRAMSPPQDRILTMERVLDRCPGAPRKKMRPSRDEDFLVYSPSLDNVSLRMPTLHSPRQIIPKNDDMQMDDGTPSTPTAESLSRRLLPLFLDDRVEERQPSQENPRKFRAPERSNRRD
jgi:hypothetical protein